VKVSFEEQRTRRSSPSATACRTQLCGQRQLAGPSNRRTVTWEPVSTALRASSGDALGVPRRYPAAVLTCTPPTFFIFERAGLAERALTCSSCSFPAACRWRLHVSEERGHEYSCVNHHFLAEPSPNTAVHVLEAPPTARNAEELPSGYSTGAVANGLPASQRNAERTRNDQKGVESCEDQRAANENLVTAASPVRVRGLVREVLLGGLHGVGAVTQRAADGAKGAQEAGGAL